jgi:LuxR family maltose regulon positive regulatory protein
MLAPMSEVSSIALRRSGGPATVTPLRAARSRRAPRLRAGALQRDRLVRRLAQAGDVPLVLLVAPAGYGKTTLLSHWLQTDRRPVRWIRPDDAGDDPQLVLGQLARALEDLGDVRRVPGDDARATQADVTRALEWVDGPFVLVLDDLHRVRSPEALDALATLAELMPEGAQLVLASREEPALPIGRLRAQGKLVDVRARDLAMTRGEATRMLRLAGLDLTPEDVLVLVRQTEGWPVGLYLAALSLAGSPDPHRAVAHYGGDDRLAADYLRDELLARLEPERLELLRCASVLDVLTGPLCDAVLGRTGSGDVLRGLSRSNALISAVDSTDVRYRCHPMLARMLRAELCRTDPVLERELHGRASAWYASAGDLDRAIAHAIQGGDAERVGGLLWSAATEHLLDGRRAKVRQWLDELGPERIATQPALVLTAAACHLVAGERDLAEHWAKVAQAHAAHLEAPDLCAGVAFVRAGVARDGVAVMDADAGRGLALAPEDSPWRALGSQLRGVAAYVRGEHEAARSLLEEGARRGAVAAPLVQVTCLAQLALLAVEQGDWEQGPLLAARAMAQVERRELFHEPASALVFAVSALVRAHRDRVEDAQADRKRATDLLTALEDQAPWFEAEVRIALARAALRLGDVTGARTLLAEASRTVSRAGDLPVLKAWVDDLWSQLEAFSATALVGPSSLTTAELRVLALLPTHLSFREMGRRLHVSANTIKTHAHAVYRKLDVCSRSEAVLRARETGLLDTKEEPPCPSS